MAVIRHVERHGYNRPWLIELLARRAKKVAAVALAKKTARIIWAFINEWRALPRTNGDARVRMRRSRKRRR